MSRSLSRTLLVLGAATSLAVSALVAAPAASASTTESAFVTKINAVRAAAGLPALSVRSDLVTAARSHSATMARQGVLSHSSLSGICCFRALAENVGSGATVGAIQAALMGSSGHRANILNPAMRDVGVGVVSSGGQLWVTEIFRAPVSGSAAGLTAPAVGPGSASRASRSTARQAPSLAAVLKTRMARLTHRAPLRSRDPLASALAWSAAMRDLTATPR